MLKTVILCGGMGTRLRPLTDRIPKPLVPLNGKPILQHIVESYIRKGYRHFALCIGYRGDMIRDFFARSSINAEIEFSDAGEGASMLQRLHYARALIGKRAFVAYGDTLIDVDLQQMLAEHEASQASITLTTADVKSPFGLIMADPDRWIRSFEEKPVQSYYIGHMLLEGIVLDDLDPQLLHLPDGDGLVTLLRWLILQRRVRMYPYSGPQITFNTHQELSQAERDLIAFFTHQEGELR